MEEDSKSKGSLIGKLAVVGAASALSVAWYLFRYRNSQQVDPKKKQAEIIEVFSQYAAEYDRAVERDKDYIAHEILPSWVTSMLPCGQPALVLDIGCGTGLSCLKFFAHGHSVIGIDVTPEMIECARQKNLPFTQLMVWNIEDTSQPLHSALGIAPKSLDACTMAGVMEFIEKPEALFCRIASVLKPNGLFALTVPQPNDDPRVDVFTHSEARVRQWATTAGFDVLHSQEFQGWIASSGYEIRYAGYLLQLKSK
eukprot:TRINITY_DN1082_c0_g1_i1.p1 TRINITY_DN1082_c0_g1~~TRINITY_DN1082_c0_g1_i1.p1  ORF type:complete len:254 (-),score=50.76 TRINITY_DN1082_c0_g1_i1:314-1075(-)